VKFIAADLPDANDLTVGVMALVAQQEREATSKRTKDALAAAKARGVQLGNPNGAAALRRAGKGNEAVIAAIMSRASRHAMDLKPVIEAIQAEGLTSLGDIAKALNNRGFLTRRGGQWHKTTVKNLMARIKESE
jgi:DNA invertase Pin-like site-specific DNA recombinase